MSAEPKMFRVSAFQMLAAPAADPTETLRNALAVIANDATELEVRLNASE
jgi:hypothetical protein